MQQYIDKSALAAEIKKRRRDWRYGSSIEAMYKSEECDDILSFLDTLEVKEVDLEKTLNGFQNFYAHENSGEFPSAIEIARHFYELGLKAQKGE